MIRHTNPGDGLRLRYRGFSDASNSPVNAPFHRYRIAECAQHHLTSQEALPAILARARRDFAAGRTPRPPRGRVARAPRLQHGNWNSKAMAVLIDKAKGS